MGETEPGNARAQASGCAYLSVALFIGMFVFHAASQGVRFKTSFGAPAAVCFEILLLLLGLGLGLFALTRVRRYGKQGILWPGLIGVCLNGGYLLLAVPAILMLGAIGHRVVAVASGIMAEESRNAPQVIPGSTVVYEEQLGYRLEVPPGFRDTRQMEGLKDYPLPPQIKHSYARPRGDGTNLSFNIQHMGGLAEPGWLSPELIRSLKSSLPAGTEITETSYDWAGMALPGYHQTTPVQDHLFSTFVVTVPLARGAIMISSTAPDETEARHVMDELLKGLQGKSNW